MVVKKIGPLENHQLRKMTEKIVKTENLEGNEDITELLPSRANGYADK